MTWYEPEDGRRHQVGVEFEEFFDLPILDPAEVAPVARIAGEDEDADKDDGEAIAEPAPESSNPGPQPRAD
jgi:hypothetical protein